MQLIIKEIENRDDFEPFSALHLVCELRCGVLRLFEKIENYFKNCSVVYHCDYEVLFDSFLKRENKNAKIIENVPTLLLYSNVVIDNVSYSEIMKIVEAASKDTIILDNKQKVIGYYFNNFNLSKLDDIDNSNNFNNNFDFNNATINCACALNYIWDLFDIVCEQINKDSIFCNTNILDNFDKDIYISNSAKIGAGVVFDSSNGKIIVDDNAQIMPLSFIQGPCYIGSRTIIKAGTKIYQNCSFGPYCKIGGELENTIFQGYSNKQHDGFIGHSFISEWVNIGAGTSNSDLKNNYSNVKIQLANKRIETEKRFLGSMIGDHCKTAINVSLNTGSIIGIFSNIAKTELTNKYISPFSWISANGLEKYELSKAILTAKVVMNRRNKELTFEEQQLITACFMNK